MLGIDIGGTKILAAVIDRQGHVVARAKNRTKVEEGAQAVINRVVGTAQQALQGAEITAARVQCAGAGAPGPLDSVAGVVLEAPNMGWKNVPLAQILADQLGIDTWLSNDVNAGTWGEYQLGAGRDVRSCLGVFVGTGIGGGIIINGELYEGAGGVAGEIGHMCLDLKGPLCGCGQRGCLEALASRTAITRDIWAEIKSGAKSKTLDAKSKGGQIRSKQLLKALADGDKVVTNVLERAARCLGIGLASTANLINPEKIVLGGGVVEALGEKYLKIVRAAFEARAFKSVLASTHIVQAQLGDDAGVLGAALLARRAAEQAALVS
jgi:glucokinase